MATRGPKVKTVAHSRGELVAIPFPKEAPAYLSERATAEYARLVDLLDGARKSSRLYRLPSRRVVRHEL